MSKTTKRRAKSKTEPGTHPDRWQKDGPDAITLLRDLHRGKLKVETAGQEVCDKYGELHSKWGTRRLKDNWLKIVKNYQLWQNGQDSKLFIET